VGPEQEQEVVIITRAKHGECSNINNEMVISFLLFLFSLHGHAAGHLFG
jgi:hypothetical protein